MSYSRRRDNRQTLIICRTLNVKISLVIKFIYFVKYSTAFYNKNLAVVRRFEKGICLLDNHLFLPLLTLSPRCFYLTSHWPGPALSIATQCKESEGQPSQKPWLIRESVDQSDDRNKCRSALGTTQRSPLRHHFACCLLGTYPDCPFPPGGSSSSRYPRRCQWPDPRHCLQPRHWPSVPVNICKTQGKLKVKV